MWQLIVGPVSELLNTVLKRVLPPEKMAEGERAKLEAEILLEMSKQDWASAQAQLQVNLEEAKSEKLFVSGWRPYIGWICGSAFAYHYVLQPFLVFALTGVPPVLDMSALMPVLLGMLGLGGLRTYEKYTGTNKRR